MEVFCGIYKITNPVGKIYIGRSKNIFKRWKAYYSLTCKQQIKLYRSLKKYGFRKHKFEIIHLCTIDELYHLEKYYIKELNCLEEDIGLNLFCGKEFINKKKKKLKKAQRKERKTESSRRYLFKKQKEEREFLISTNWTMSLQNIKSPINNFKL